jgi:hypothetical protein
VQRLDFWSLFNRVIAQGPGQGALPVLYAAVGDVHSDSFTGPKHLMHMRGGAELIAQSKTAQDPELAQRLWTVSEELTGVHATIELGATTPRPIGPSAGPGHRPHDRW